MITGFNTDIPHEGVTYHVQTEDKGLDSPLILSLVYVGGAIIASKRTNYDDLIRAGFDEKVLTERLQRQHKLICAAIRAGRVEELKRMGASQGEPVESNGHAPVEGRVASGGKRKKSAPHDEVAQVSREEAARASQVETDSVEQVGVTEQDEVSRVAQVEASRAPQVEAVEDEDVAESSSDEPIQTYTGDIEIITSLIDEISALTGGLPSPPGEHVPLPKAAQPVHEELPVESSAVADDRTVTTRQPFAVRHPAHVPLQNLPPTDAPNDGPEEIYLSLLDDEGEFRAGQLATIKIQVGRGTYGRKPVGGATVTVKILGTMFRPLIFTAGTNAHGIAVVRTMLPRFTSGRAAIIIRAMDGDDAAEMRRIIHQA